jgi:hypothetical protein
MSLTKVNLSNIKDIPEFDPDDVSKALVGTPSVDGDGQLVLAGSNQPSIFKRKVMRQQEVPYVRKVKVPVITKKLEPARVRMRIKSKRLVETQRMVEQDHGETFMEEYEEKKKVVRWVRTTGFEEVRVKVPVTRTRKVKKRITRIVEKDHYEMVEIPGTKVVETQGFRIDEIVERKLVEVFDWEEYELRAHTTGKKNIGASRVVSERKGVTSRRTGAVVYTQADYETLGLDVQETDTQAAHLAEDVPLWGNTSRYSSNITTLNGLEYHDTSRNVSGRFNVTQRREAFNLEKCCAWVKRYLTEVNADVDAEQFVSVLKQRWLHVDADVSGLVSYEELRLAVWNREEDNAGIPMPAGKFRKQLQDIVDQIHAGTGSKNEFTFWDFTNYLLTVDEMGDGTVISNPPADDWAVVTRAY